MSRPGPSISLVSVLSLSLSLLTVRVYFYPLTLFLFVQEKSKKWFDHFVLPLESPFFAHPRRVNPTLYHILSTLLLTSSPAPTYPFTHQESLLCLVAFLLSYVTRENPVGTMIIELFFSKRIFIRQLKSLIISFM